MPSDDNVKLTADNYYLLVIEALRNIKKDYPEYRIRYEYDKEARDHIVEIDPWPNDNSSIFDRFINLQHWFAERFLYESIMFVKREDIVRINNPLYDSGVS